MDKETGTKLTARVESPIDKSLLVPFLSTLNESELYHTWLPNWTAGPQLRSVQGTSNGGRQFLSNRRSNRHIVPLYGKSDRLFTGVFRFEERLQPFEVPWKLRRPLRSRRAAFLAGLSVVCCS
jgi:hypothetical protein